MPQLGSRVRTVLAEKNISQAELARLLGVKQQTISYICSQTSPATSSRYATKIAEVLGVNPAWLQTGDGNAHDPSVRIEIGGVDVSLRRVPLVAAKAVVAAIKGGAAPTVFGNVFLMTDIEAGLHTFAIQIEDESMAPLFRPGDRVLVDPDLLPEPGDFVVASANKSTIFRKYRCRDGEGFELSPMNDDWSVVQGKDDTVKVLGVMIEHRSYRPRKSA